jgi:hypothetical protein
MAEPGLKTGTIVTKNEDDRVDADGGTIEVIPAWRYLLDLAEPATITTRRVPARSTEEKEGRRRVQRQPNR